MIRSSFGMFVLLGLVIGSVPVFAEGEAAPAPAKDDGKAASPDVDLNAAESADDADDYASLLTKWQAIEQRLAKIEYEFYHTPTSDRAALSKQFQAILDDEAKPVLAKLRKEAMAEYGENPNKDEKLIKLLVGMIISDARLGQEADALELVLLLAKHKCDQKYIDVLPDGKQLSPDALEMLMRMRNRFIDASKAESVDGTN